MSDIVAKLESLKAVAGDSGATKSERDGATLMIGKLIVKHQIILAMPVASKPKPEPKPRPAATRTNDPVKHWSVYVPDAVLKRSDFKELFDMMASTSFMAGNLLICVDFTHQDRITNLIRAWWEEEKKAASVITPDYTNAPTYVMLGLMAIVGIMLAVAIL